MGNVHSKALRERVVETYLEGELTKKQVAQRGVQLQKEGSNENPHEQWSSYRLGRKPCGGRWPAMRT